MKTLPEVRVIRAFQGWRVGDKFRPTALYRCHLIQDGYVELVKAEDVAAPTIAAVASEVPMPRRSKAKAKVRA